MATALLLLLTLAAPAKAAATCPNAQFRTGPSAHLPDCRAYEQVTPVDKNDEEAPYQVNGFLDYPQAAADGNQAAYFSYGGFSGSPASNPFYLVTRGATDWSSQGITPPQSTVGFLQCVPEYVAYTQDLSKGVLANGKNFAFCGGADDPPLVPGEPRGAQNLFLRNNATGAYQLLDVTPSGVTPADAIFEGGSTDLSHVVFSEAAQLTPDAPASGSGLYEWAGGSVSALSLIPNAPDTSCSGAECVPVSGAELGITPVSGGTRVANAVSDDGSRAFFTSGGNLYVREGSTTTEVDAAQGGSGSSGGGIYWTATTDGASVFLTDSNELTADASPAGADLYRYDVGTGDLTDLTPDSTDPGGAAVEGVVGTSDDGSYLYFVADGVLTTAPSSRGDTATAGEPNLYLLQGGTTKFIATLSPTDAGVWGSSNFGTARVTPDGSHVAFTSIQSITGYDNSDAGDGSADNEVFVYDAGADKLSCASCNPSSARPSGSSDLVHTKTSLLASFNNFSVARDFSADGGEVFFHSHDALVPADTNGMQDVYEWEAPGSGSCQQGSAPNGGGCVYLISSGHDTHDTYFFDASKSGSDVFFVTYQQLVGQDDDGLQDLYDARVGGGLASQDPPPPPAPCQGDACKNTSGRAPPAPVPASVSFFGPGNPSPTAKVRVLSRTVHGARFLVKVRVPGPGRIEIKGAGIRTVRRSVAKAGTYRLRVSLTKKARRALAHKRRMKSAKRRRMLRLKLRVAYRPASGPVSAATVRLTVKPARHHTRKSRRTRTASYDRGGAR